MKTTSIVASLVAAMALSSVVEAKTVLSAKERCFRLGQQLEGGWNEVLKIRPQQALTDKKGAVIEVVGVSHGSRAVTPALNYYNQFAGAASYIAGGDQEVVGTVIQIALVGTSYGTHSGAVDGVPGVWSFQYSLMLEPEQKGKILFGRLVGEETFRAVEATQKEDPLVDSIGR